MSSQALENRSSPGPEIVSHIPIDNLYILVHPLDSMPGKDILANNQTRRVRNELRANVLNRFLPQSAKDLLVVIPRIGTENGELKRNVRATKTNEMLFPEWRSWISLYKDCKIRTSFPDNILLAENIAMEEVSSRSVEERLRKKGFGIMSDTRIIIGGEYAEDCVLNSTVDLLSLAQVQEVFLDPRATLGISDYTKHTDFPASSLQTFREIVTWFGHKTSPDKGYLRISNL